VDRIVNRHFDPVTGKMYHIVNAPPQEQAIRERLVPYFPDMNQDKIEKRWNLWNQFQVKVEESYQEIEEYTIQEVNNHICEFLQNPLF